jgi:hypothetical protein
VRQRQSILAAFSEITYVNRILERASSEILLDFLSALAAQDLGRDRVAALVVMAAIFDRNRDEIWLSQQSMITAFIHKAFAINPLLTCELVAALTGMDANIFMTRHHDRFVDMLYMSCRDQ